MPGGREEGLWTSAVVLILASFLFACATLGAVEVWARSVLGAGAAAAFLLALAAGRLHPLPGEMGDRVRLLVPEMLVLGILCLGVIQILPLPSELHRTLSPAASRLFDDGLPPGEGDRWRTLSVYPWATRVEVLRLAALGAVFSLFARGLRRTAEARFALLGFVALGTLSACLGVLDSSLGGDLLGWYPREGTFRDRVAGVLVNPNHFAGMMEMTLFGALGLLFASGAREDQGGGREGERGWRPPWTGEDRGPAVGLLLAAAMAAMALALTGSRLGAFSALIGGTVFALLLTRRGGSPRLFGGLALLTLVVLSLNAGIAGDRALERWSLFSSGGGGLGGGRLEAWSVAGTMGLEFPVSGTGWGTFGHIFPSRQPPGLGGTWDHAHNDWLQAFVEGGVPGALLVLALTAAWLEGALGAALGESPRRRALAGGCIAGVVALGIHGTGDFNFQIPGNAFLAAALAGIAYGLSPEGAPRRSKGREKRRS